jgi:hypothetical protein
MMKIKTILVLFLLVMCTSLQAQITKKYSVSFDTYAERSKLYFLKFSGVRKPTL